MRHRDHANPAQRFGRCWSNDEPEPLVERRRTSPALAAFVAATIVADVAALTWATLTFPLGPGIATDGLGEYRCR